tara:strand:+ start:605 stop:1264 length:660 start_codon:yes stop_codon:yes gene_type:complete
MHFTVQNLIYINKEIDIKLNDVKKAEKPKIIAVSKTFPMENILPLIEYGHLDYGENKVQEALEKWSEIKLTNKDIKLHLLGKLQRNKVKSAVRIFDYIHSVDSKKLAKKIAEENFFQKKNIKVFIQVNIGDEDQKSGLNAKDIKEFYLYCKEINLNVIGLMCIPPMNENPSKYFSKIKKLNDELKFIHLSLGMSSDYIKAIEYSSTFLRIGTNIFGSRG